MASVSEAIEISFDPDFWIDVEVPANVIKDNWDEEHYDNLRAVVNSQTVVRKELELYWRQFNPDDEDLPGKKEQMLIAIGGHNIEWSYNLYCIHQFGRNRASEYINYYFQQLGDEAETRGLEDYHDDFGTNSRRFGKLILIDLIDRKSFRDILVLDFCKGKMPDVNAKSDNILSNPVDNLDMDTVLHQLGADSREYNKWHDFEYNSEQYIAIKRHIRDRVERQVNENQDVAEADLVVLRFVGDRLMVYAPTPSIANRARTGVNAAVGDDVDEEISFDFEGETADWDHFDDFRAKVEKIGGYDDDKAELTAIGVRQSPLAGSPKIEIKGDGSILTALDQLRQADFDLLADPERVRYLKVKYDDRPYRVYLNRPEQDGEKRWALRYSSSTPSEQEREAFESFVDEVLGLVPIYRHS